MKWLLIIVVIFVIKTTSFDAESEKTTERVTESSTESSHSSESNTEDFTTPEADHSWATEAEYTTIPEQTKDVEPEHDVEDTAAFDNDLSDDAINSLTNSTNRTSITVNMTQMTLEEQKQYIQWEWWNDLRHFGHENAFLRVCYYLATTYRNAMTDLRKYYQIRYMYYDNVEYEIGYVTHEIIFKYQIVLELYHLMQRKFESNQDRHIAPTTYMLYIYTNILFQSTDIIHLCNMMHEIENKYKNYRSKGPFADDQGPEKTSIGNRTQAEREKAIAAYNKKLAAIEKKIRREQKKRMKMIQKGKIFSPTIRTTRTYKKFWDLHYGWSIETW